MNDCRHDPAHKCVKCAPELWYPGEAAARAYTINYLSSLITKAKEAYYAGNPIMRDEEYDSLEISLRAYDPDNPALKKVGS